jgi:hypothetical protein
VIEDAIMIVRRVGSCKLTSANPTLRTAAFGDGLP